MLKRLSEAISQSNSDNILPASDTHCSQHSSCNFSPQSGVNEANARAFQVLRALPEAVRREARLSRT